MQGDEANLFIIYWRWGVVFVSKINVIPVAV